MSAGNGKAFRDLLLRHIRQAGREILIDIQCLEFDAVGQTLLSELEYACQRGLRVCCLMDSNGSQQFIEDHPALFSHLETQFRLHPHYDKGSKAHLTCVVFDRTLAVTGYFPLSEDCLQQQGPSSIADGQTAQDLARQFDSAWETATPGA